jgi:hypothetical protein
LELQAALAGDAWVDLYEIRTSEACIGCESCAHAFITKADSSNKHLRAYA